MKKFTIPNACHEYYEDMVPEEKGKFCSVCKTKVYDFTTATQTEIETAYLKEKGEICGKILVNSTPQRSVFQQSALRFRSYSETSWSKIGIAASAASFLLTISGCSQKIKNNGNYQYEDSDSTSVFIDSVAVSDSAASYEIMGKMVPPDKQNSRSTVGKVMQRPPDKESNTVPGPASYIKDNTLPPTKDQL